MPRPLIPAALALLLAPPALSQAPSAPPGAAVSCEAPPDALSAATCADPGAVASNFGATAGGVTGLAFRTPLKGQGIWIGLALGLGIVAVLMLWRWSRRERLGLVLARTH